MPILTGGVVMPGDGFLQGALEGAGAPAANAFAGQVRVGSVYINTTGGVMYICTATNGSTTATWTVVGAQV
jgi:hypothetical protein